MSRRSFVCSECDGSVAHAARGSKGSQGCREDADDDLNDGLPSFFFHSPFDLMVKHFRFKKSAPQALLSLILVEAIVAIVVTVVTTTGVVATTTVFTVSGIGAATLIAGLVATVTALRAAVAALRAAIAGIIASRVASVLVFSLLVQERIDVDKLGLLQELTAGDVLLGSLLGQESDVESLQVLVHIEILLLQGTILLVLEGAIEGAKPLNLYLLRLQQHLDETAAELLQYAVDDVGGVD